MYLLVLYLSALIQGLRISFRALQLCVLISLLKDPRWPSNNWMRGRARTGLNGADVKKVGANKLTNQVVVTSQAPSQHAMDVRVRSLDPRVLAKLCLPREHPCIPPWHLVIGSQIISTCAIPPQPSAAALFAAGANFWIFKVTRSSNLAPRAMMRSASYIDMLA